MKINSFQGDLMFQLQKNNWWQWRYANLAQKRAHMRGTPKPIRQHFSCSKEINTSETEGDSCFTQGERRSWVCLWHIQNSHGCSDVLWPGWTRQNKWSWTSTLFSELNIIFLGCFDPTISISWIINNSFWGDLTGVSAKAKAPVSNTSYWRCQQGWWLELSSLYNRIWGQNVWCQNLNTFNLWKTTKKEVSTNTASTKSGRATLCCVSMNLQRHHKPRRVLSNNTVADSNLDIWATLHKQGVQNRLCKHPHPSPLAFKNLTGAEDGATISTTPSTPNQLPIL